jgi:hypothetical protein
MFPSATTRVDDTLSASLTFYVESLLNTMHLFNRQYSPYRIKILGRLFSRGLKPCIINFTKANRSNPSYPQNEKKCKYFYFLEFFFQVISGQPSWLYIYSIINLVLSWIIIKDTFLTAYPWSLYQTIYDSVYNPRTKTRLLVLRWLLWNNDYTMHCVFICMCNYWSGFHSWNGKL